MKVNKWTLGLAAVGLVSLPSLMQAEEKASPMMTALSSTTISGYVSTSMEWNPGTGNAYVPGFAFNPGKQDGFNLDVINLTIERPLDESQWAAGYKVDLIFGPDANALNTTSALSPFGVGGNNNSDFAIKQAYVALRAPVGNGLDFKLGTFDTMMGYESFHAGNNPNYTRSYGYSIEPTTHTGLQANYTISPTVSVGGAIVNTYGPTINARSNPPKAESYKAYMGTVALTAPESFGFLKGSTLYGCIMNGFNQSSPAQPGNAAGVQSSAYVGGTMNTPVKDLKVGAAWDYAMVRGTDTTAHGHAQAVSLYASYQASEKLSLHARGEYYWDSNNLVPTAPTPVPGVSEPTGIIPGKVFALTGTIQYDLWKNVLSRLEIRWDHAANGISAYGGNFNQTTPVDQVNAVLIAANIIYKF